MVTVDDGGGVVERELPEGRPPRRWLDDIADWRGCRGCPRLTAMSSREDRQEDGWMTSQTGVAVEAVRG